MSKVDELEKEAEDYAEQCYGWTNNDLALDVAEATYIASAEPREKRIAELEQQIEKMKCCENCEVFYDDTWHTKACDNCKNLCNWQLKE